MGVSENSGTPKSSILIGFSIINHPFWGIPIFGNTHMEFFQWQAATSKVQRLRFLGAWKTNRRLFPPSRRNPRVEMAGKPPELFGW